MPNKITESAWIRYFFLNAKCVKNMNPSKKAILIKVVIVPTLMLAALAMAMFIELKLLTPTLAFMVRLIPKADAV